LREKRLKFLKYINICCFTFQVGEEEPEEANDACLEIELLEGTFQDLPGAEDLPLAEDFYNTDAGPSGIDVAANRTQPMTFDHQEPGTSTPSTKPDTRRATESCKTRKRKRLMLQIIPWLMKC
jgi:hypothetical protein